jgi:hypothetical protein
VARLFGYLSHAPCIYEKGTAIEITAVGSATILTRIRRGKERPVEANWNRESFESLVTLFTIIEEGKSPG